MQLVGATNTFIVKPYVLNFVRHSLIAIPIAMGLLLTVFYGLPNLFQDFAIIQDFTKHVAMNELLIICVSVSIFGLILASFGSWLSTRRYLRTKIENLY
jgi:cell division transport system permease protein